MLYQTLRDFWRVGYHADPLHVTLEYQDGSGRFDDPERKLTVLYGAEDPRTCILEIARPWKPRPEAADVINAVPEPELASGENDAALLEEMRRHAERDREIATEPLRMPADAEHTDQRQDSDAYSTTTFIANEVRIEFAEPKIMLSRLGKDDIARRLRGRQLRQSFRQGVA